MGIFKKNLDFSIWFGLLSVHKPIFRPLKVDFQEDFQKTVLVFACKQETRVFFCFFSMSAFLATSFVFAALLLKQQQINGRHDPKSARFNLPSRTFSMCQGKCTSSLLRR